MKNKLYGICPHCGEEIEENAKVCHNCGSDENTGWSENTYLDEIDIPNSDEYEELKENEFGKKKHKSVGWITVTGFFLIIVFLYFLMQNFRM